MESRFILAILSALASIEYDNLIVQVSLRWLTLKSRECFDCSKD